jgi:hypothetical protein
VEGKGGWPHSIQTGLQGSDEGKACSEAILIVPQDSAPWSKQSSGDNYDTPVDNVPDEAEKGKRREDLTCTM